jgi:hypothetical protein
MALDVVMGVVDEVVGLGAREREVEPEDPGGKEMVEPLRVETLA